ncbi:MAG: hypothetical protein V3S31_00585, partial [Dehalococcoidia bacterium]
LSRMRILVVGTYRDTDITRQSALTETLASLNREGGIERVVLRGLSRNEVGSYIEATAHVAPSRTLVDRIHEETEGNPFFLSEVVNLMTQEGTLDAATSREIALPDGVREALGRRLDRLSEEANELLQIAAVAGREFQFETLSVLGDHDEEGLLSLIEEGLDARVIEETGSAGQYRFTHALMQETLLDELSTTRRVRLHGRIGEALEERWGDRADERATRLATHFVEAATLTERHAEKGMHYSKLAAARAEEQAGWGEAARRYEDCLTLLTETEARLSEDEAALLTVLGRCWRLAGEARAAFRSAMRAREICRARGDGTGMAAASLEAIEVGPERAREVSLAEEALEALGEGDSHLRARLLAFRAGVHHQGLPDDASRHAAELARELTESHDFADVKALLTYGEANRAASELRLDEARALYREAHEAFSRIGDHQQAATSLRHAAFWAEVAGDLDEADALAEEVIDHNRALHLLFNPEIHSLRAWIAFARGDFESATSLATEMPDDHPYRTTVLGTIAELRGDFGYPLPTVPPNYALPRSPVPSQTEGERARRLFHAGDEEGAQKELDLWSDSDLRQLEWPTTPQLSYYTRVDGVLAALGTEALVRETYERFVGWPQVRSKSLAVDVLRGQLALRLDLTDKAEQHFSEGLGWCERERCPIDAGRCHQGLAEVASRRGNSAEAMEHLDAASKVFEQYGAKLYLDQVIAKKLELQGVSPSGGSGDDTVPAGEPEVTLKAPEPGDTLPSGGTDKPGR